MSASIKAVLTGVVCFALGAVSTSFIHGEGGTLTGTQTHVAFVFRDIDKASKEFGDLFGVKVPPPMTLRNVPWGTQGKKMSVKYTNFPAIGLTIEILQNVDGDGLYNEHIAKYGEGFHHFGLAVADVQQTKNMLVAKGATVTLPYNADDTFVDIHPKVPFSFDLVKAGR
jgi:hypothetical protein